MCVRWLDVAWGESVCGIVVSFARLYRIGLWFLFCQACTASCGCYKHCVHIRGDAWPMLLSPCNNMMWQMFLALRPFGPLGPGRSGPGFTCQAERLKFITLLTHARPRHPLPQERATAAPA